MALPGTLREQGNAHFLQFPTTLIPRTAADVASSGRVGGKMHLCGAGQDQTEMTSEKPTDEFHNISQLHTTTIFMLPSGRRATEFCDVVASNVQRRFTKG